MGVAFNMENQFPIKWTNEVYSEFLSININSTEVLLNYITNKALNPKLKKHKLATMNYTTIQALAQASAKFWIDKVVHQYWFTNKQQLSRLSIGINQLSIR